MIFRHVFGIWAWRVWSTKKKGREASEYFLVILKAFHTVSHIASCSFILNKCVIIIAWEFIPLVKESDIFAIGIHLITLTYRNSTFLQFKYDLVMLTVCFWAHSSSAGDRAELRCDGVAHFGNKRLILGWFLCRPFYNLGPIKRNQKNIRRIPLNEMTELLCRCFNAHLISFWYESVFIINCVE